MKKEICLECQIQDRLSRGLDVGATVIKSAEFMWDRHQTVSCPAPTGGYPRHFWGGKGVRLEDVEPPEWCCYQLEHVLLDRLTDFKDRGIDI